MNTVLLILYAVGILAWVYFCIRLSAEYLLPLAVVWPVALIRVAILLFYKLSNR